MVRLKGEHIIRKSSGEKPEKSNSMLTTREVARMLNVHTNSVRKWSDLGILKSYRVGPRRDRRYRKEDVVTFIRK